MLKKPLRPGRPRTVKRQEGGNGMEDGRTQLRDRMLRDAIVEVLRGSFDARRAGDAISLVDAGLIGDVIVVGDRVRVELPLPSEWSPFAGSLVTEIQRRVQALPEVTVTEIAVISGEASNPTERRT
jgi:metal-sulfur cluster biosynthetic enzyme